MATPTYFIRFIFLTGSAVCLAIFWFAGRAFGVPYFTGQEGSLLQMPGAVGSLLVAAVIFYLCTALGTLLSGRIYFDGGFFLGAVGLSALSMRAGTMGVVLRSASGQGIFLLLAVEVAILYAIVTVAWLALRRLSLQGKLPRPELPKLKTAKAEPKLADCLMATGIQALITGLVLLLLAQSDAKSQVLVAVGLSACAASAATTYWFYPTVDAIWLWIGPLIVALVGYVSSYFLASGWSAGLMHWGLCELARPLPLDYASFGSAGALLGHWMARRWHHLDSVEQAAQTA